MYQRKQVKEKERLSPERVNKLLGKFPKISRRLKEEYRRNFADGYLGRTEATFIQMMLREFFENPGVSWEFIKNCIYPFYDIAQMIAYHENGRTLLPDNLLCPNAEFSPYEIKIQLREQSRLSGERDKNL